MKKMIKGAVYTALGASVLTLAATANAADINVNIFGAPLRQNSGMALPLPFLNLIRAVPV